MANLALLDLVLPYVLRGENIGPTHAALSALRVVQFETATDDLAVALRGHCEVNGSLEFFPSSGALVAGGVDEAAPPHDPSRSDPIFDLRDTSIDFELFVPRQPSQIIAQGQTQLAASDTTAVLDDFAAATAGDYPSTGFTFDLILNAPKLRPPFLHPAKVSPIGTLMPDDSVEEVALVLPRLRFRFRHGNNTGDQLVLSFVGAGVSSLDDPGSVEVSQFISMEPPYAYIGGEQDRAVGIGFRSATLDLDGDFTPPALRDKAGVGDDWTGLYLPEVRVFVAPDGLRNLAFECGAQELLIGVGRTTGIWGDFDAALVQQGDGDLKVLPRFDSGGKTFGVTIGATVAGVVQATARVPQHSTLIIDVSGGRAPYARTVKINGTAQATAVMYDLDLGVAGTATVDIEVQSGSPTAQPAKLHLDVTRLIPEVNVGTPGGAPGAGAGAGTTKATITTQGGPFTFALSDGPADQVTLRSTPAEPALVWSSAAVGANPAITNAGPSAQLTSSVAPGTDRVFTVTKAGPTAPANLDYYFFFDSPGAGGSGAMSTKPATSKLASTWSAGAQDPIAAYGEHFGNLANNTQLTIVGNASFEGDASDLAKKYNTMLAWRRATAVQASIEAQFPNKFQFAIEPVLVDPQAPTLAERNTWASNVGWISHGAPNDREHWRARVSFTPNTPDQNGSVTVHRDAAPTPKPPVTPKDPPVPEVSPPPPWFRSAKVTVRIVDSQLIALQLDLEVDINTMTEQKLQGQMGGAPAGTQLPRGRTLDHGTPVGPNNPADGIMAMRVLVQTDPSTGRWTTLLTVGADPADTDGLVQFGWIPNVDAMPPSKDLGVTFLGSYLSFWPMLAAVPPVDAVRNAVEGREGGIVDASLSAAALATPAIVAALPWFSVERVILFGAEYLHSQLDGGFTGTLLADIEIDWSIDLLGLVTIKREQPLKIRYKAIGLSLTNRDGDDDGTAPTARWDFRPVFDATRGYTIDVASGGGLKIAEPLGQILRVLGARLSRSNPMTLEVDIALGVDLGVVAIDQASVRAYLDGSAPPELTALAARIDIPGVLAGAGYMRIGNEVDAQGNTIGTIGGQLDLTIRPVSVRVCAAVEVATITEAATGRQTTGVYVGLSVVLPAGIPLGSTGLGIFGFRGIFGMHYERNAEIGANTGVPALAWLRAAGGQPHLLRGPDLSGPGTGQILWKPKIDRWAFGVGILIGTMEGGVLINLDGTFLLELPGPRVLIMMNARIVSPPPSVGELGMTAGILAVIEITPEHFLIGILVTWEVEQLVKIVIPVEAVFPFGANAQDWHIYLGARKDYGPSVEVDVLGIVKGTGYLMFRGNGLQQFNNGHAQFPALTGFGIALGVAASFTWGDVDAGIYLKIGGGMDVVLGFKPFTLVGNIYVAGELRLWIVSIGADASLTVKVAENSAGDIDLSIHGEACGRVNFFFFSVSGCVDITISAPDPVVQIPPLVEKVSLQSRSPALAQGSAVDRGVDTSLGLAPENAAMPAAGDMPVVPIDAIPVISMIVPPIAAAGVTVGGLGTALTTAPGVGPDGFAERSGDKYHYEITALSLERVKGNGQLDTPVLSGGAGAGAAPVVWWTINPPTEANPAAQLALLTWQAAPATKAIEYTDKLVETIIDRWGTVCTPAAPPAEVLWTFKLEALGASMTGWDLEGIAWPDPPGTQRSVAPDTTMHVSEPWRTGDAQLDGLRGVIPAIVVGSTVKCDRGTTRPDIVRDVLGAAATATAAVAGSGRIAVGGAGPVDDARRSGMLLTADAAAHRLLAPSADSLDVRLSHAFDDKATGAMAGIDALAEWDEAATFGDALQLSAMGTTVSGPQWHLALQALGRSTTGVHPATGTQGGLCPVKALRAPMLDNGLASNFADKATRRTLAAAGIKDEHRELYDTVQIHTGGYDSLGLLLFVPRQIAAAKTLVVRVLDGLGNETDRVAVSSSDLLVSGAALPPNWVDPAGPWGGDVEDLVQWANTTATLPAYVKVPKASDPASIVEIGLTEPTTIAQQEKGVTARYLVAAIGLVSAAEVARHDWDQQQIDSDHQQLTNAVGPASSDHALLVPNSRYRVVVEYFATRKAGGSLGSAATPQRQTFWFRTDTIVADPADNTRLVFADTPEAVPVRLDPWTMMTMPDDNEKGWFGHGHEKLRLVFNTHDVDRFFGAYGKELRLRLEAANGQHPQDTGTTQHPLPITATTLVPIAATLLSPWEEALIDAISQGEPGCIAVDQTRVQHSEVEFDIPLHPFMEYLLDVELVDQGAAPTARGPRVFRRHFTTGAFGTIAGLASSVAGTLTNSRAAQPDAFGTMLATLGQRPQGSAVDTHLLGFQLEPLGVPDQPQVVVFWQQTGAADPQPAAIMIDATEPLSRSRNYPHEITDTTVPDAPKRWVMQPREWLTLRGGGDAGAVAGIVYVPGDQRAFVVLAPNSRGRHVTVDLVSLAMPDLPFLDNGEQSYPLVDVTLDHAPWEEV